jgi:hypothetical protein
LLFKGVVSISFDPDLFFETLFFHTFGFFLLALLLCFAELLKAALFLLSGFFHFFLLALF